MESLSSILPIVIYVLLIIFLTIAIILGIKAVFMLDKVNLLVEDVTTKVKTLDRIFKVIDLASDKVTAVGESIISYTTKLFGKMFRKKMKDMEDDEDE